MPMDDGRALPVLTSSPPSRMRSQWRRSSNCWTSARAGLMRWRSFVALGDSFTEGMDDPYEDGRGYRGWADLVAGPAGGRRRRADDFRLRQPRRPGPAVPARGRGAGTGRDRDEARPDHVRRRRQRRAASRLRSGRADAAGSTTTIRDLRATGADVVLFRWADVTGRLPGGRVIGPRVRADERRRGRTAERHGALVVDMWGDPAFREHPDVERRPAAPVGGRATVGSPPTS